MPRKPSRRQLEFLWTSFNIQTFNGLPHEDPKIWIGAIDQISNKLGVPISQRMLTAIYFLGGSLKMVMKPVKQYLKSREDVPSCKEKWEEFKRVLVDLHEQAKDKENQEYVKLATGHNLLIAGSSVMLPSLGILAVNAVGFTSSGVAAGSLAAGLQSLVYGAYTGGLFSVLQSIGATAVVAPPFALGLGMVALGTGLAIKLSKAGGGDRSDAGEAEKGGGEEGNDDEEDFDDCGCSSCGTEVPEVSSR